MMHPDTALRFITTEIGLGVVATQLIPRGCVTWAQDELDMVIAPERLAEMPKVLQDGVVSHRFFDALGNSILAWDHGRFVNHSCAPNCSNTGMNFEIALRDILPGEELTDDYAMLNLDLLVPCLCGAPKCRGTVLSSEFPRIVLDADALVRAAFPFIAQVEQPLWSLVTDKTQIEQGLADAAKIPSCAQNFHRHENRNFSSTNGE